MDTFFVIGIIVLVNYVAWKIVEKEQYATQHSKKKKFIKET